MKSLITLTLTMLQVLEAVVEKGIEPLSSAGGKDTSSGHNFLKVYQKRNAPPAVAAPPAKRNSSPPWKNLNLSPLSLVQT